MNAHAAPNSPAPSGRREGVKYRPFVTKPGEALILPLDPVDRVLRGGEFTDALGLPRDAVVDSQMVAIPVPSYAVPAEGEGAGARWGRVKPEMLWHPLFWLPERLAARYTSHDEDDRMTVETDDHWALRVMWEMTASALYDPETGEWADVLALAGLDIDDPETLMRVTEWQLGVADEILDAITLDDLLRVETDPDWSIVAASSIEDAVRRTVWARSANTLLDWSYRSEQSFEDDKDLDRLRRNITSILRTGQALLVGVTEDGYGSHNAPGIDPFWADQISALPTTSDADLPSLLLDEISVHCGDIRDSHWDITTEFWDAYADDNAIGGNAETVTRVSDDD